MIAALALTAAIGACAGSFICVAVHRATRAEQSLAGRSRCDCCATPLGATDTIPLVSYAVLGGACRHCSAPINRGYPVVEVIGACVAASAFALVGGAGGLVVAALGLVLLWLALEDAWRGRLPGALTLSVATLSAVLSLMHGFAGLGVGLAAATVSYAVMQAVRWSAAETVGRPAIGRGDISLIAALAVWLGPATPWAMAVSAAAFLAWMVLRPAMARPFGPFLAAGFFLVGLAREAGSWTGI